MYHFLISDDHEKTFILKPITRRDGSHALMIQLQEGPNHLTIDENYLNETECEKYFYYYAHIRMIKNEARVRIYTEPLR